MKKKKKRGYDEQAWKGAIVRALRAKGFTKKGAKKTAVMTMRKHIECLHRKKREKSRPPAIVPPPAKPANALSSQKGVVFIPPTGLN